MPPELSPAANASMPHARSGPRGTQGRTWCRSGRRRACSRSAVPVDSLSHAATTIPFRRSASKHRMTLSFASCRGPLRSERAAGSAGEPCGALLPASSRQRPGQGR